MSKPFHIIYSKEPSVRWMVPFCSRELTAVFSAMLNAVHYPPGSSPALELSFLDDGAMAALNSRAMGCTGPTNVLSFPSSGAPPQENRYLPDGAAVEKEGRDRCQSAFPSLGLLAVAPATVLRECLLYGQEKEEHFIRLFAHGLAHLMGHDHGPEMEEVCRAMERAGFESAIRL